MRALRGVGAAMAGVSIIAAAIYAAVVLTNGAAYIGAEMLPFLQSSVAILVVVCVIILSPLSLLRRTRMISAYGFLALSFVVGLCTWMYGFFMTYDIWGGAGIVIGILLAGVGVVPLGVIAAALHSEWSPAIEIVVGLMLTFGSHLFSLFLAEKSVDSSGYGDDSTAG